MTGVFYHRNSQDPFKCILIVFWIDFLQHPSNLRKEEFIVSICFQSVNDLNQSSYRVYHISEPQDNKRTEQGA